MEWNPNVELSSACAWALSAQPHALDSLTFGFHSIENSDTSCFTNCSSNLCVIPEDLHTVDNGVLSVLYPELLRPDWQLLIAHFLGVDHCGHKYGPSHPEMAKKLAQINEVIQNVTSGLDKDTILFVFGDHGMTQTGDHGGDSREELGAALFAYTPATLHHEPENLKGEVSQMDLVPTVSLLLDLPVPFSSLGRVIPSFFPDALLRQAASANAWQVVRYAETYSQKSGDGSLARKFDPLLKIVYGLSPKELTPTRCLDLVGQLQRVFAESWAKFHNGWMAIGLLILLENFLWSLRLLWMSAEEKGRLGWDGRRFFLKISSLFLMSVALVMEQETVPPILGMVETFQIAYDMHGFALSLLCWTGDPPEWVSVVNAIGFLLSCLAVFSNSFVVYEDAVLRYISQSLLLCLLINRAAPDPKRRRQRCGSFPKFLDAYFGLRTLLFGLVGLILLRLGSLYNRCREEQGPSCQVSLFTVPFASLSDKNPHKMMRFLSGMLCLFAVFGFYRWFLRRNGHLLGDGYTKLAVSAGCGISVVCISAYWVTFWLPEAVTHRYSVLIQIVLPGVVYVAFLLFWIAYLGMTQKRRLMFEKFWV